MRPTRFSSTAVLAALLLSTAACGSSSDGGASPDTGPSQASGPQADTEGFCEQAAAYAAAAERSADAVMDDESLAQFRSLRNAAPDQIREDMDLLLGVFEQVTAIDDDAAGAAEEVFGLLFDPDVVEASENVEAYGVDECGLEPTGDDTGFDDTGSDTASDAAGGLENPLYDPTFDDPVDPSVASIDGLQLHLDETYPNATWRPGLSSFGQYGDDFDVGGVDIEADATEICEAVLAYATSFAPEATVEVNTFSDDFGDEIPVVTGSAADGCVTV